MPVYSRGGKTVFADNDSEAEKKLSSSSNDDNDSGSSGGGSSSSSSSGGSSRDKSPGRVTVEEQIKDRLSKGKELTPGQKRAAKQKGIDISKSSTRNKNKSKSSSGGSSSSSNQEKKTINISRGTKYVVVQEDGTTTPTNNYQWAKQRAKKVGGAVINTSSGKEQINKTLSRFSQSVNESKSDLATAQANILNRGANEIYAKGGKDSESFKNVTRKLNQMGTAAVISPSLSDPNYQQKVQGIKDRVKDVYAKKLGVDTQFYAQDNITGKTRKLNPGEKALILGSLDQRKSTAFGQNKNIYTATDYYRREPFSKPEKVTSKKFSDVKPGEIKNDSSRMGRDNRKILGLGSSGSDSVVDKKENKSYGKRFLTSLGEVAGEMIKSPAEGLVKSFRTPFQRIGLFKPSESVKKAFQITTDKNKVSKKAYNAFKRLDRQTTVKGKLYKDPDVQNFALIGGLGAGGTGLLGRAGVSLAEGAYTFFVGKAGVDAVKNKFSPQSTANFAFVAAPGAVKSVANLPRNIRDAKVNIKSYSTSPKETLKFWKKSPSKQFEKLKKQTSKVNRGATEATGDFRYTQSMKRTNQFDPFTKTKVSTKATEFGPLKGEMLSKDVKIRDVIGKDLSVREVTSRTNPNVEVKYIFDKSAGKAAEVSYYKGKKVDSNVFKLKQGEAPINKIKIDDPVTRELSEQVGGKGGKTASRKSDTFQSFELETGQGKYTGLFTERQSQYARINKNLRELQMSADLNTGKFNMGKKTSKARVEFGDPRKLVDEVTFGEIRGKNVITQQKAQPRTKTTTLRNQDLRFKYTNRPDKSPKPFSDKFKANWRMNRKTNKRPIQETKSGKLVQELETVTVPKSKPATLQDVGKMVRESFSKQKTLGSLTKSKTKINIPFKTLSKPKSNSKSVPPATKTMEASASMVDFSEPKSSLEIPTIKSSFETADLKSSPSLSAEPGTIIEEVQEISKKSDINKKISSDIKPKQNIIPTQKINTEQKISQKVRQDTTQDIIQKPIAKSLTDSSGAPFGRVIKQDKPNVPRIPGFVPSNEENRGSYEVFVREQGKDVPIAKKSTLDKARTALKNNLGQTLRASGYVKSKGKKVPLDLGSKYRKSKKDPLRVVEKRRHRLDSRSEVSQIQFGRKKKGKKSIQSFWGF